MEKVIIREILINLRKYNIVDFPSRISLSIGKVEKVKPMKHQSTNVEFSLSMQPVIFGFILNIK